MIEPGINCYTSSNTGQGSATFFERDCRESIVGYKRTGKA
ncbi:hypothetical protein FTV88_2929 [Heliorestis convoluta]|uniref:Uncharacterized protein n=1 Tax=Heliorestis convoluta TaxID=356322 RepID=A0A5Q2N1Z2_9FIRM|nr:hypothetical protein FTV88_2929 [Heliorestis convoluta]